MKKIKQQLLVCLVVVFTIVSCKSDDDAPPANPLTALPLPTQIGAQTFGCLLDGQPFVPGNGPNPLDCVYQFVDGGFYFGLQANRTVGDNRILLGLGTNNLEIFENQRYPLMQNESDSAYAVYSFNSLSSETNNINKGEFIITKLDFDNNIVSGTFWYDIEDYSGVVHQIRAGRFDVRFTQ